MILHRHHRIPLHAGGDDSRANVVMLTVAEHAEAHRLLFLQFRRWQDRVAWRGLAGIVPHEQAVQEAMASARRGTTHSVETKEKMSAAKRGKPTWTKGTTASIETRQKMSAARVGKTLSPASREKIRLSKLAYWAARRNA